MSILKRLSLTAAVLTFAGCTMSSGQSNDTYYENDFTLKTPRSATAVSERAEGDKAAEFASNTPIVSEVSKKIAAIETKLRQVQKNIKKATDSFRDLKNKSAEEADHYYEYVARIRARLQNGTTPGNPELTEMWKQASALLSGSDKNMSETAKLSSEMVRAKNELDSLLETIRETFSVPGAMEIDHENLKQLEDESNQTIVSLKRLSSELSLQIARQQRYFSTESQNVNALSTEIQAGRVSNGNVSQMVPSAAATKPAKPAYLPSAIDLPETDISGRRPLMVIRFNKRDMDYEQSLYKAVKAALDKRPSTHFEVVAVSPADTRSGAFEAAKNADAVRESLLAMGLPASRIYSSQASKPGIKTTEVHLYLK